MRSNTLCLGKRSLPRLRLVSSGRRRLWKAIAQFHLFFARVDCRFLELRPSLHEQLAMFGLDVEENHHLRHIVPSRPLPSHPGACLAIPSRGCDGSLAVECQAILLGSGPQGQEGALCGVHCLAGLLLLLRKRLLGLNDILQPLHSECRLFLVRVASFVLGGNGGILAQVHREALADVPPGIKLALLQCLLYRSQVFVVGSACLFVMQVLELLSQKHSRPHQPGWVLQSPRL